MILKMSLLVFLQVTVLFIGLSSTQGAMPSQTPSSSHHIGNRGAFEKAWRAKLNLSRDRETSHTPHFRRRGLLTKYRKKRDALSTILADRKLRDDMINKLLLSKALEKNDSKWGQPDNETDTDQGSNIVEEARKARDRFIEELMKEREIEKEELDDGRAANDTELLERAEDTAEVAAMMNGSDQHIWDRRKRWAAAQYDPDYDWENAGLEDDSGKAASSSEFVEFAKNWQMRALKFIFAFSIICMLLFCCLGCCKKICGEFCGVACWHLREWRDLCLNRDPTYRKLRKFADDYGLEFDYDHYKKLKGNYEEALHKQDVHLDMSGR